MRLDYMHNTIEQPYVQIVECNFMSDRLIAHSEALAKVSKLDSSFASYNKCWAWYGRCKNLHFESFLPLNGSAKYDNWQLI